MKFKLPLLAAIYSGLTAVGSAFTMDFSSVPIGANLPQTVTVAGYGSVTFTSLGGPLSVQSFIPGNFNAIGFSGGDAIIMTFTGSLPMNVSNQYIGVGTGEAFTMTVTANPNQYLVYLNTSPGANAGLQSVSFSAIPEPSSAVLGLAALSLSVLRRRR